jgi:hypothetical protein
MKHLDEIGMKPQGRGQGKGRPGEVEENGGEAQCPGVIK